MQQGGGTTADEADSACPVWSNVTLPREIFSQDDRYPMQTNSLTTNGLVCEWKVGVSQAQTLWSRSSAFSRLFGCFNELFIRCELSLGLVVNLIVYHILTAHYGFKTVFAMIKVSRTFYFSITARSCSVSDLKTFSWERFMVVLMNFLMTQTQITWRGVYLAIDFR